MTDRIYRRILLKISGESLQGNNGAAYDANAVSNVVRRIKRIAETGVQIALVTGAGNIWRGKYGAENGMDRVSADQMGMLATVMNALCLKNAFNAAGMACEVHSAVGMSPFAKRYERDAAVADLDAGKIVILACGSGLPFFTTDTAAAVRALELKCQVLLKATKVNGIYTADPKKNPDAQRFETIAFSEVLQRKLAVMDSTAFALCSENNLHIIVFDFSDEDAAVKMLSGDYSSGTLVY